MTQFSDSSALAIRTLPVATYQSLRRSLLEQIQHPNCLLITETDLAPQGAILHPWTELLLIVTPDIQGLLMQRQATAEAAPANADTCTVGMMTATKEVMAVIDALMSLEISSLLYQKLLSGKQLLCDRAESSCPDLILTLLPALIATSAPPDAGAPPPVTSTISPVQAKLDQQLEQALLLNQVITKIRQSLDLATILATTVEEVRPFLKADRLLIYQFQPKTSTEAAVAGVEQPSSFLHSLPNAGYITYESIGRQHLDSIIHSTEEHCFQDAEICRDRYLNGQPIAINDTYARYQDSPCLLNFLQKAQVRAKIIAPIVVQGELWGLLIAHDCRSPRVWQPRELIFLQHIAEHLSIAVQQAELYEQLQQQAHSLEACVVDRTQNLRDALAAAQTANLAKSEFLATMSHELRTPLTCIIGMSATLLRWSFGELSPRQRNYLTTIHESGDRLLELINDILEMAKIESGRTVLEIDSFSLTALAQQVVESFRQQARDSDLDLTFESGLLAGQDHFVGDSRRIQQILSNLLSNALKFTGRHGQVHLRIRRENHVAVFQVEDTGIGIPESQVPLLFEKFQQLETSRQRQYQGTGLGLALTKQLAELHGGTIAVNSRVDVGSVFTVRIPLQRIISEADVRNKMLEDAPNQPIVGRIVLVEDQEDTAGVICDLLTAADYQVIWVIEGSRVVEQVALLQPTVVIINMQLSSIDGQRIIRALRDSLITNQVKILAMGTPQNSLRFKNADATLLMPLDPEMLLEKVNALTAIAL
ncbi:MAG: ATP-binding protein [Cyanobacteria bacterium J06638_28]